MSIQYEVVMTGIRHFSREVNKKLKEGWELHGDPHFDNGTMVQALIKTTTTKKTGTKK